MGRSAARLCSSALVAVQLLLVCAATAPAPCGGGLLDVFLPGPTSIWELGKQEIVEKLDFLKTIFSGTRLIAKVKPEYRERFVEAVRGEGDPEVVNKLSLASVEAESKTAGLEVLKVKDGLDIIALLFDLQALDLFEFVELDFEQRLPLAESGVDPSSTNHAKEAWEQINLENLEELVEAKKQQQEEVLVPERSLLKDTATQLALSLTSVSEAIIPTDRSFFRQWGVRNIGMDRTWPLLGSSSASSQEGGSGFPASAADGRSPQLDPTRQDNREIIVAVLDTGVDYTHPDLKGKMWVNVAERDGIPGVDDDGNGCIDDVYGCNIVGQQNGDYDVMDRSGHGTHCAGTIAAVQNNTVGISGLAPNAKIMAVKIFNDDGSGFDSDAILGIDYAIRMGAQISSNSWSVAGEERLGVQSLEAAVRASYEAGQVFVGAAGNSGKDTDDVSYREFPAGLNEPNIISVMATDEDNRVASFSAGRRSNYGSKTVDIAAPGRAIYSTVNGGGWDYKSGTSMAVPFVAATAAVVYEELAANGNFTGAAPPDRALLTKAVILYSSIYVPALKDRCLSEGRLSAYGSLVAARTGMTGNFSALLFPQVPDSSVTAFAEQYKWTIILVAALAGFVLLAVLIACCCCCFARSRSSSNKYRAP